ncbi:VanZ family protein [Paenibacillus sp. sptzw28]|uniref:VanZ family protein n=1 Tax=Paenibacillus sp. sptzw28 TaxID=715179 RepID=UPI001C6F258B|nr:VanZ family protein [Paenibacillus sp. sptzw28]QYR23661.1 VanZ family protein [Paenibacillus sp. sptzw28]
MKQTKSAAGEIEQRRRSWLYAIPAVIVMAVIFIFSAQTGDELNTFLPWFRELFPGMTNFDWGHFIAYFLLALAIDFGFGSKADSWKYKVLIVALCGLYGVTDEFHQSFVGGRTPDIHDIRNDCIGGALAMLVIAVPAVRKWWRKLTS